MNRCPSIWILWVTNEKSSQGVWHFSPFQLTSFSHHELIKQSFPTLKGKQMLHWQSQVSNKIKLKAWEETKHTSSQGWPLFHRELKHVNFMSMAHLLVLTPEKSYWFMLFINFFLFVNKDTTTELILMCVGGAERIKCLHFFCKFNFFFFTGILISFLVFPNFYQQCLQLAYSFPNHLKQ